MMNSPTKSRIPNARTRYSHPYQMKKSDCTGACRNMPDQSELEVMVQHPRSSTSLTAALAAPEMAAALLVFLQQPLGAQPGADVDMQGSCQAYVDRAVSSQKRNVARKCGFEGPEWNDQAAVHLEWCLKGNLRQASRQDQRRQELLKSCSASGYQAGGGDARREPRPSKLDAMTREAPAFAICAKFQVGPWPDCKCPKGLTGSKCDQPVVN